MTAIVQTDHPICTSVNCIHALLAVLLDESLTGLPRDQQYVSCLLTKKRKVYAVERGLMALKALDTCWRPHHVL